MQRCPLALLSPLRLALVLSVTGCVGPQETRFLTCWTRSPGAEARSYDAHDPFPDEAIGPETSTRPRAFLDPRSETRKSFDLRMLQAMHPSSPAAQFARGPIRPYHQPGMVQNAPIAAAVYPPPTPNLPLTTAAGVPTFSRAFRPVWEFDPRDPMASGVVSQTAKDAPPDGLATNAAVPTAAIPLVSPR